jgi:hypothetical protein
LTDSLAQAGAGDAVVISVRTASTAEWRGAFSGSTDTTFFHGPTWAELWAEYSGGALVPSPRLVEFADGRTAVIGATRAPTRLPFVKRDQLSPEGNCGGWVSCDALGDEHRRRLAQIVLESPSLIWRIGPCDGELHSLAPPDARSEMTHIVDLTVGVAEARQRWRKGARQTALRALRRGVRVREGRSAADWQAFRDLYRRCVDAWERPLFVYRPELFDMLARRTEDGVRLWLAEVDGAATAGTILLGHGDYTTGWLGVSLHSDPPGAMNALQWEIIEALAGEGCNVYDLNGSAGLDGVVSFKEHIGAAPAPVVAIERRHPLERVARRALRRPSR